MRRDTQHMLMLLLGGALVQIAANGVYLRYVRPGQRWLLIAGGAVTVVLAVVALIADGRRARVVAERRPSSGQESARHGGSPAPWLLLLPVLVIALAAPPALGADAVGLRGPGNTLSARDLMPPLPPGDAPELTLTEFVQRAVWDTGHSLDGREVTLTGFVVRRGAAIDLARLRIVCCAADAQAHRVHLVGDVGSPSDTWLRVRGALEPGSATAADRYVPAVTVTSVEIVPAPDDPYEY